MYETEGDHRVGGVFLTQKYAEQAAAMIKVEYKDRTWYDVTISEIIANDFDIKKCREHIDNDIDWAWHTENCFTAGCPCGLRDDGEEEE